MASLPREAPELPRAPTAIRKAGDGLHASPPPSLPADFGAPPPRFPSLSDVGIAHASAAAGELGAGRAASPAAAASAPLRERREDVREAVDVWGGDLSPVAAAEDVDVFAPEPSVERTEPVRELRDEWRRKEAERVNVAARGAIGGGGEEAEEKTPGIVEKIKALLKPREKSAAELEKEARIKAETKPALVKAKEAILHNVRPTALKTWTARLLVPLTLVPTVAASALWRRTRVISRKPEDKILSAAAPFPNASLLVTKGEKLRMREAAVAKAEADLLAAQRKLEVQRKEVESRLPPHVDVAVDPTTGTVRRTMSREAGAASLATAL